MLTSRHGGGSPRPNSTARSRRRRKWRLRCGLNDGNNEMLKLASTLLAFVAVPAAAQQLTPAEVGQVDQLVAKTLAETGVPSAEIAVVRRGRLVLDKAYGKANEGLPARAELPYQI